MFVRELILGVEVCEGGERAFAESVQLITKELNFFSALLNDLVELALLSQFPVLRESLT